MSSVLTRGVRDQMARLHQRHLQFGRRGRLDAHALLARSARISREAQAGPTPPAPTDHIRRATVEAIEYCMRLDLGNFRLN